MQINKQGAIEYLSSDALDPARVIHAIFTRKGGISPSPWDSLNFGSTVGDELGNVFENKRRAFESMRIDQNSIFDVWQVHSREVIFTNSPRHSTEKHQKADIIVTDQPGVVLLMRFADCVPLLFYDRHKNVAGIAHAGWQGTVKGVATTVVDAMRSNYYSHPADITAIIGPSIGPDHYKIGPDVVDQVKLAFGNDSSSILHQGDGYTYFDLWSANRIQLEHSGVRVIETSGICTACHPEDWYSHRGQGGKTGRFGVIISLLA
jgi:hypothetical protein